MDWLFIPLGKFFSWTFKIIVGLGDLFNYFLIVVGVALIVYWILEMKKYGPVDKGFFRKD